MVVVAITPFQFTWIELNDYVYASVYVNLLRKIDESI